MSIQRRSDELVDLLRPDFVGNDGTASPSFVSVSAPKTRNLFVPAVHHNETNRAPFVYGWLLLEAETNKRVFGWCKVPEDFASDMTSEMVVCEAAAGIAGNVWALHRIYYAADGEVYNTHTATSGFIAFALGINRHVHEVLPIALAAAAKGDILLFEGWRFGTDVNDTYGATAYYMGWLLTYTAEL